MFVLISSSFQQTRQGVTEMDEGIGEGRNKITHDFAIYTTQKRYRLPLSDPEWSSYRLNGREEE